MSTKRAWVWTGRLVALVAAVVIPACGQTGSSGQRQANGIMWNSPGTGAPSQPGNGSGGSLWVDPNTGLGAATIGISNIVTSADDATYATFKPGSTILSSSGTNFGDIQYIFANNHPEAQHPLSTDTGTLSVTQRESELEGQINGYRQQQLGNVGAGGGLNGGLVVGNTTGIILPSHFIGTKMARAHCKHYAQFHDINFDGGMNPEGDAMLTTDLNNNFQSLLTNPNAAGCAFGTQSTSMTNLQNVFGDRGRLGKLGVIAFNGNGGPGGNVLANDSIGLSGMNLGEPGEAFAILLVTYPFEIGALGWTNMAVGHWRGGFQGFYWNIIFLFNPQPSN